MAPKTRMDLELRYNALSHQSLLWIDSCGTAKVIEEMPLPYVKNVLNILDSNDLANDSHPLVIALTEQAKTLSESDDEDDNEGGDELLDLLSDAPSVVRGLVRALDEVGLISAYRSASGHSND